LGEQLHAQKSQGKFSSQQAVNNSARDGGQRGEEKAQQCSQMKSSHRQEKDGFSILNLLFG